ncbi:MAG: 1-hydroxycarotenoid 3,4-desaturase CrtD [Sphingobacteriaceae bacterium]
MGNTKVFIIGAGLGGIATAIRLAVKKYEVHVFEANTYPGGKLSEISMQGYRFDAGPSLLTMPQYIDELFELAGEKPAAYFKYQRLKTICRYFYEDGTRINAFADIDKLTAEIAKQTHTAPGAVKKYFENSSLIYRVTNHVFLEKSLHRLGTFLNLATLRSALRLPQIDAFRSMHRANQQFFDDPKMVQFFDRYATYNGSDPFQAPATLNVIPHLEQAFGAYFPQGGMYSIVKSMVGLAESIGVKFHYGEPVQEIVLENQRVKAIIVKEKYIPCDLVVSNMDVWFTYRQLLKKHPSLLPHKILKQERSSSALIFYWGIKKRFDQLDLHNVFFSTDYCQEFDHIWKAKDISADPTVYINISSKSNPTDAPEGCENWFTMINVPSNTGQNWDELIKNARENILKKLARILGENISSLITCETILDPRSIEARTSAYQGSLYGPSSNNQFAAFLRHANRSAKVKNLYFCGGSVHPGGGIPLVLLSAKMVSEWVGEKAGSEKTD